MGAKRKAEAIVSPQLEIVKNLKQAIDSESAEAGEAETRADNNGFGELDATGRPLTSASEKDQDCVSPETARRVRRELEQSKEQFEKLPYEDKQKIERELGCSIQAYIRKPFKEILNPA